MLVGYVDGQIGAQAGAADVLVADRQVRGERQCAARTVRRTMGPVGRSDSEAARLLRTIYQQHAPVLLKYLMRLTEGNHQEAEDLVQETMLRAWRNIDQLAAAPESIRPWLFTVARNCTIDLKRARRARPTEFALHEAQVPAIGDAVDELVTAAAVRRALDELTPDHRAVITELYFRAATLAEVAARLGIPQGTVKSRAHYALRGLRAALARLDDDGELAGRAARGR